MADQALHQLIAVAGQARTLEEAREVCAGLARAFGFGRFLYLAQFPNSFVKPEVCELVDSRDVPALVVDERVRVRALGGVCPLLWRDLVPEGPMGISVPIHGPQGEWALLSLGEPARPNPPAAAELA